MVKYTIDAVPTTYKGINFRSKLEAQWAVFFELIGLEWEYEPCNLKGWFPDFSVPLWKTCTTLVEVKPVDSFDQNTGSKMAQASPLDVSLWLVGTKAEDWRVGWVSPAGSHSPSEGRLWVPFGIKGASQFWAQAKNAIQWKPPAKRSQPQRAVAPTIVPYVEKPTELQLMIRGKLLEALREGPLNVVEIVAVTDLTKSRVYDGLSHHGHRYFCHAGDRRSGDGGQKWGVARGAELRYLNALKVDTDEEILKRNERIKELLADNLS